MQQSLFPANQRASPSGDPPTSRGRDGTGDAHKRTTKNTTIKSRRLPVASSSPTKSTRKKPPPVLSASANHQRRPPTSTIRGGASSSSTSRHSTHRLPPKPSPFGSLYRHNSKTSATKPQSKPTLPPMPHDWAQALVQERLAAMQQDQPAPADNRNDMGKDTDGVHLEDFPGTTTDPSQTAASAVTSVPPATALTRHYEQRNEYLQTTLPRRKWKAWHTFVSVLHCWPYPPHHVGYVDVAVVDLYDGGEPSFPACWKHFRQDMVQHFGQHKPVQG